MKKKHPYFGLIGNGQTAALVGGDLAIRWLCIPRFDRTPVFAGALDPSAGGFLSFELTDSAGMPILLSPVDQRYEGASGLLTTRVSSPGWLVRSTDYMPWGVHGLVREVTLTNTGSDPAEILVRAVAEPIRSSLFPVAVEKADGRMLIQSAEGSLLISTAPLEGANPVRVLPGADCQLRFVLAYGTDEAAAGAALVDVCQSSLDRELAIWREWLADAQQLGPQAPAHWQESYLLSLIILKLLTYEPTGAFLAAPTASLPAVPGGADNWDYRYAWLRDGYYTAMTLNAAGLHRESERFYQFAFSLLGAEGHWHQPLYTVDGGDPVEMIAEDLAGPDGERPIRFGNAASGQLQLDNEGNIIHGLWFHYQTTGNLAVLERHWADVRRACNWTGANWRRPESGIWELREYTAHWVHGKVMCHAALEAGAQIAEILGHASEAEAWRAEAEAIRREVLEQGWNNERQAYLAHYGSEVPPHLDISALALVFYGLLAPDDPRALATVRLMTQEQSQGGLALHGGICRYDYGAVPFYLPTLWLARYYLMAGRLEECDRIIEQCLACTTDLGLMAEHFDGRTARQWGNFPQAFSHEELARLMLERSQGWTFCQPDRRLSLLNR